MANSFATALSNLKSFYNGNIYNASTNAGGMANGGHRPNFIPALQDVSVVGQGIDARTQAAIDAGGVFATSTDVETPAVGAMTFTVQTGKGFGTDMLVKAVSRSDATNFAIGPVTSYDGVTTGDLVLDVQQIGPSAASASDWDVYTFNPISVGGEDISSATSVTLGVGSAGLQMVTFTAASQTLTLPDATTLIRGRRFTIHNEGSNSFEILASGGGFLLTMPAGARATVILDDNGSAAGTWIARELFGAVPLKPRTETVFKASAQQRNAVAALDATHLLLVYSNGGVEAVVADISNPDSISFGTPVSIDTPSNVPVSAVAVSSTQAVVAWADTTANTGEMMVVDISGTVITTNTVAVFEPATSTVDTSKLVKVSATAVIVGWEKSGTGTRVRHADITDPDAVSFGTAVTLNGTAGDIAGIVSLSATLFAMLYTTTSANIALFSLSGTSITDEGDIGLGTGAGGIAALDANHLAVTFFDVPAQIFMLIRVNSASSWERLWSIPLRYIPSGFLFDGVAALSANRVVTALMAGTYPNSAVLGEAWDKVGPSLQVRGGALEVAAKNGDSAVSAHNGLHLAAIDANTLVFVYADDANSDFGTLRVINVGTIT